jgi:acetyl-CoA carboxylase carboxyltransferase component
MESGRAAEKTGADAFPLYDSVPVDKSSDAYQQNVADWTSVLKTYQEGLSWCVSQGRSHYEERHKQRGLLLARDRVRLLIDSDTPFLELGCFAGYRLDSSSPAASLITGIGVVRFLPAPRWLTVAA